MKTAKEILKVEAESPCPFGLPRVSEEEITAAADAIRKSSNHMIAEFAAKNLAYAALVALRREHFEWHAREGGNADG